MKRPAPRRSANTAGFTLLEVLVALAIFATVAAVVLTAAGRSLNNAARLEQITFADWIADNRITELQLADPIPAEGSETLELEFANRRWQVLSEVEATSEPLMRRVTVWVAEAQPRGGNRNANLRDRSISSLTGFIEVRQ
ncbi:type II secretion system minor pseudopilin GspI [Stutzerimonas azotifigens]|uniref:Type II secretion system protein I n=1 Tax=Stutzerimonas azotifigens TaxID=291995 RepID=A0ABR5Z3U6_9GAMM|nr:type II secretion system minor pseudopilin GspI [Stutzerimonas azotifigens]MBA1274809.1 type II secretion system minor pseudopilin GspI [Stutzerimonas azotifigens]